MTYDSLPLVFQWVLLTLASYRLQRIVTADHWPPSEWLRQTVDRRFGEQSSWAKFIGCPYCFGTWATLAVFAIAAQLISTPLPVLQATAAAGVVGFIGVYDE